MAVLSRCTSIGIASSSPLDSDTIDDQLRGTPALTQVGLTLAHLGIHAIPAHSPQAKGRLEHLFETFQDRMWGLQLNNITTIPEANAVLSDFVVRHIARIAQVAAAPG